MASEDPYFVPTKAAPCPTNYSCVVFSKPIKKKNPENNTSLPTESKKKAALKTKRQVIQEKKEFSKERRKEMYELYNFSKSEMSIKMKFQEDVKRIVQLGAAPMRVKVNYKVFKEKFKKLKRNEKEQKVLQKKMLLENVPVVMNKQKENNKIKRRSKNKTGNIEGMLEQYGKVKKINPKKGKNRR